MNKILFLSMLGLLANSATEALADDFSNNTVNSSSDIYGGVYTSSGNAELSDVNFENNIVSSSQNIYGGIMYNSSGNATLADVTFMGNTVTSGKFQGWVQGGMIANGEYMSITNATFTGNEVSVSHEEGRVQGGIIENGGYMSITNATFTGNEFEGGKFYGKVEGGIIYNKYGYISIINATFTDNTFTGFGSGVEGGMINNYEGYMSLTNATFTGNEVNSYGGVSGGMILNDGEAALTGATFTGNTVKSSGEYGRTDIVGGGMIANEGTLTLTNTSFTGNTVTARAVLGGMIASFGEAALTGATFTGNTVKSFDEYERNDFVVGGMITNDGTLTLTNTSFTGNTVTGSSVFGGIIANIGDLTIIADGQDSVFKDNTITGAGDDSVRGGAIYSDEGTIITLEAKKAGNIIFDDEIDGEDYALTISGDNGAIAPNDGKFLENKNASEVQFLANVNNVQTLNLNKGGIMHLGKDTTISTEDYVGGGVMKLDVEVDSAAQNVQSGLLNVSKSVSGKTDVIVNSLNKESFRNAATKFVDSKNATADDAFRVAAVYGSPYAWNAKMNIKDGDTGGQWYVVQDVDSPLIGDESGDNSGNTGGNTSGAYYQPEVAAYVGLERAAIEQTRSLTHDVAQGLAFKGNRICADDGCVEDPLLPKQEAWAHASYESATINAPSEFDADIKGLTAGVDLFRDYDQRAGVFAAYRTGNYDFNGKGDFKARYNSDLDIKSYTGGLYYQRNKNNWKTLATVFAGTQDIDVKSKASYTNGSTDAMQYGASAEIARTFAYAEHLSLEPSLGLSYTMLDVDDLHDNMGKTAEFDMLHYLEIELGLKAEYRFCNGTCANYIYVKPSIIKTFANNAKTKITDLNGARAYDDELLARLEVGGDFGLTNKLSAYVSGGYTFGDDYDAYDVNLGARYAF